MMAMSSHERRYLLWRSSAAPKKAAASDKIAFARASSRFSFRNAAFCTRSSSTDPGGAAGRAVDEDICCVAPCDARHLQARLGVVVRLARI